MHFLIVEDRAADRELITRRLQRHFADLQLTEVPNADAFRQALQQDSFDLILTDYELGWTDGLEVLRQVKARFPATPVVMFTESGNEEVAAEGMREGLSDYLLKKHLERLPAAIQASLERARLQQELDRSRQELQRSHDELEARVQERTVELAQANERLQQQTEELQEQQAEMEVQAEELRRQTEKLLLSNQSREKLLVQVEQARQLSEALNRINVLLSATFDVRAVAEEVFGQAIRALGVEAAALAWREEADWVVSAVYGLPPEFKRHCTDPEAESMTRLAQQREVWAVNDQEADQESAAGLDCPCRLRAALYVPLLLGEQLLGLMAFGYRSTPFQFSLAQLDFARKVAASLALSLENEQLHEQTRQDAETRATLLREVNHRVKNNLAAIVGLLYAQLDRPDLAQWPEYRTAIQELTRRVEGLGIVHSMLSSSQWTPLRLDELAERILRSALQAVPPEQVRIQVEPSSVRVAPEQAHTLALVVNELALNVAKHVLQEGGVCQVTLAATQEEDRAVLIMRDNGPGYPEDVLTKQRLGVGLELIRNLVTRNLRGQIDFRNKEGAVTEIRFPLAELGAGEKGRG